MTARSQLTAGRTIRCIQSGREKKDEMTTAVYFGNKNKVWVNLLKDTTSEYARKTFVCDFDSRLSKFELSLCRFSSSCSFNPAL